MSVASSFLCFEAIEFQFNVSWCRLEFDCVFDRKSGFDDGHAPCRQYDPIVIIPVLIAEDRRHVFLRPTNVFHRLCGEIGDSQGERQALVVDGLLLWNDGALPSIRSFFLPVGTAASARGWSGSLESVKQRISISSFRATGLGRSSSVNSSRRRSGGRSPGTMIFSAFETSDCDKRMISLHRGQRSTARGGMALAIRPEYRHCVHCKNVESDIAAIHVTDRSNRIRVFERRSF
jgi:hypothetical protein